MDFVASEADVENEISRLIYRNCSPTSQYFMRRGSKIGRKSLKIEQHEAFFHVFSTCFERYKSDLIRAMQEKES